MVRVGLIQARWEGDVEGMIRKNERMIDEAADKKIRIVCLQELFYSQYFPAEQDEKWYELAESIPGPITERMRGKAKEDGIVLIVPIFEKEAPGFYYNTAVVFDADGRMLGKYRKNHIPHLPNFWEKFYFRPGNLGYPVFDTAYGKIGVYICYDRHFPEGARALGLNGADMIFNPSATVKGLSEHLWDLEQRAHAVANGYFVGAINRVGVEQSGEFYGRSYICDPRGEVIAEGSEERDELVWADLDLRMVDEVRKIWQFYRDRRPETYGKVVEL
jgi:N-carbamoylputrescine amidase